MSPREELEKKREEGMAEYICHAIEVFWECFTPEKEFNLYEMTAFSSFLEVSGIIPEKAGDFVVHIYNQLYHHELAN